MVYKLLMEDINKFSAAFEYLSGVGVLCFIKDITYIDAKVDIEELKAKLGELNIGGFILKELKPEDTAREIEDARTWLVERFHLANAIDVIERLKEEEHRIEEEHQEELRNLSKWLNALELRMEKLQITEEVGHG